LGSFPMGMPVLVLGYPKSLAIFSTNQEVAKTNLIRKLIPKDSRLISPPVQGYLFV